MYMYNKPSLNGPRHEKTCLRWFANSKGADQPAHTRSLTSAFVIRFLESIISRLATSEIQAGLNITSLETPKTGFQAMRPIYSRLSLTQLCITQYYDLTRPDGQVPVFSPIYYCNSTTFIWTTAKSIKLITRYKNLVPLINFSVFYNA